MLSKTVENINILNKKYDLIKDAHELVSKTDESVVILNICNNMNTFGAGFNKVIAKNFPIAKENYHLLGPSKIKRALGHTQIVKSYENKTHKNAIFVANMICQTGIISESNLRPINYYYLAICLAKTQSFIKQYRQESESKISVYTHKYSSEYLGANWFFIKDLMLDTLIKPTFINVYQ